MGRIRRFHADHADGRSRRIFLFAAPSRERLLTEPEATAQPWRRELVLMPHCRPLPTVGKPAELGVKHELRDWLASCNSHADRGAQVRSRLRAGGKWIRTISPALAKSLSAVAERRTRTDKLERVIKHRSSLETTMVGRGASPQGRLFLGGTDRRYGAGGEEWQLCRCIFSMECRDARAERPEQIPRRSGPE